MPEILKELLTTYWPQTILIIGGIAYLLKLTFDLRSKKVELKYSLFEQSRVNLIMKFLTAYLELEENFKAIPEGRLKLRELSLEIYDSMYLKKNANLYSCFFYLKLYLDPLELARYADLVTEMRAISNEIKEVLIKIDENPNLEIEAGLKSFIVQKIENNNTNFKVIAELFRKYSNKPYYLRLK